MEKSELLFEKYKIPQLWVSPFKLVYIVITVEVIVYCRIFILYFFGPIYFSGNNFILKNKAFRQKTLHSHWKQCMQGSIPFLGMCAALGIRIIFCNQIVLSPINPARFPNKINNCGAEKESDYIPFINFSRIERMKWIIAISIMFFRIRIIYSFQPPQK